MKQVKSQYRHSTLGHEWCQESVDVTLLDFLSQKEHCVLASHYSLAVQPLDFVPQVSNFLFIT